MLFFNFLKSLNYLLLLKSGRFAVIQISLGYLNLSWKI